MHVPSPPYRMPRDTFFSNELDHDGINLPIREFYIPWVMNKANPSQLFLGTYRLTAPTTPKTPSAATCAGTRSALT